MISYSPTNVDIASSVFSGLACWSIGRGGFVNGAVKQYISLLIATNIANQSNVIKKTLPNSLITDTDFWLGIVRVLLTTYELGSTNLNTDKEKVISSDTTVEKVTKEVVETEDGEEIKRSITDKYTEDDEPVKSPCKETEPLFTNGYPNKKITTDLISSVVSNILARIIFEERKIYFI